MDWKSFICLCLCILNALADKEVPKATTPLGKVSGSYKISADGRTFAAFEGIPYAKPPIGNLRFSEPQPIQKWQGTWQANTLVTCIQAGLFDGKIEGTEDCLYINVYVPRKEIKPSENLDVIVHIHGGAYMIGSGHGFCGPEYIMDRDVVYVTMNYRVNIFGFLSMADEVLPGNNGLKDQSLALKWIQENIASFGGNPNSVTLTGLSAGGSSVHYHYLSPLSKGLFHRGFSQSGTALNPWALQDEPVQQAKRLASLAGCPDTNSKAIASCLRQRNADYLVSKMKEFTLIEGLPIGSIAPFAPSIERGIKNAFLPNHPIFLLTQNKVLDVPWITSITKDEGVFFTSIILPHLSAINKNWNKWAPLILDYNYTAAPSTWPQIAQSVKNYYNGNEDFSLETADKYTDMISQRYFKIDAELSAKLQSKANKSPVYFYVFDYQSSSSLTKMIPDNPLKGVSHGDDGLFLYSMLPMLDIKLDAEETELKNAFLDMLVSYSKTGVPSFEGATWEPTEGSEIRYLKINSRTDMKMAVDKKLTHKNFWLDLGLLENQNLVIMDKDEL